MSSTDGTVVSIFIHDEMAGYPTRMARIGGSFSRNACRAIIVDDGKILCTRLIQREQYLTPGGGIDAGEDVAQCLRRECREELGIVVAVGKPLVLVAESYAGIVRFRNLYVSCRLLEQGLPVERTEEEIQLGLTGHWLKTDEAMGFFSNLKPHQASFERQPPFINQAIANSPLRESLALAVQQGLDLRCVQASFEVAAKVRIDISPMPVTLAVKTIQSELVSRSDGSLEVETAAGCGR